MSRDGPSSQFHLISCCLEPSLTGSWPWLQGPHDDQDGTGGPSGYGKLATSAAGIRDHNSFQIFIIVVICVAGLLVGIQTYPSAVTSTGGTCTPPGSDECDGGVLKGIDWAILIIFTLEVFLKIVAEHNKPWRYFTSSGWNLFDFFIVAMCYMPFAGRAVAVLRLLRLLRVLKLVKQLPQLQMIVGGLRKFPNNLSLRPLTYSQHTPIDP